MKNRKRFLDAFSALENTPKPNISSLLSTEHNSCGYKLMAIVKFKSHSSICPTKKNKNITNYPSTEEK